MLQNRTFHEDVEDVLLLYTGPKSVWNVHLDPLLVLVQKSAVAFFDLHPSSKIKCENFHDVCPLSRRGDAQRVVAVFSVICNG